MSVQVQRSSDGPVQLLADFVCSIAFHTWRSFNFKQVLYQEALPNALETAARAIMMPAALNSLAGQDLLTALVGLEPLSLLPNQISLTDSQPASHLEPAMLVVVLVHLFRTVALDHLTQSQEDSSVTDTQRQPEQMQPNADQCFKCIDLLRGALVVFKLIQLAGSVQDPHAIGPAMSALWSVLAVTEKTIRTQFCSAAKDQLHAGLSTEEYREQLQSCLLLVQVIMLVQEQLSQAQVTVSCVAVSWRLQVCLAMEDVLIRLHHKEVALEIVKSGKHGPYDHKLFLSVCLTNRLALFLCDCLYGCLPICLSGSSFQLPVCLRICPFVCTCSSLAQRLSVNASCLKKFYKLVGCKSFAYHTSLF